MPFNRRPALCGLSGGSPPRPDHRPSLFVSLVLLLLSIPTLRAQENYSVRVWQSENGLPVNIVHSIVQDTEGYIWVATAEGVARFDGLKFEAIPTPPGFQSSSNGNDRLFATRGGHVWFANATGCLIKIKGTTVTPIWLDDKTPDDLPVTQLLNSPQGTVLAIKGGACWEIDDANPRLLNPLSPDLAKLIDADLQRRASRGRRGPNNNAGTLVDQGGSRWQINNTGILTVTDATGTERIVSLPRVGNEFDVTEMLEDREGNVWIATSLHGIGLFREDRVDVLRAAAGLSRSAALAVLEDSRDNVWIANRNGGVELLRKDQAEHFDLPIGQGHRGVVSALYEDREHRLWAATREGPIFRWLGWRFVEEFIHLGNPPQINAIFQDGEGTMWFGGQNGLARSTGRELTQVGLDLGFPGGEVSVMSPGLQEELWLGTTQGFVLQCIDGRLQTIGSPSDLLYRRISGILVEAPNRIWVTTLGSGLFLYNGSRWNHFGEEQGLPNSRLTHIIDDQLGHFWFGSAGGILRASRHDLLARAANADSPIHWLIMDRSDGLPTSECVGGHNPAGWRFKDKSIWLPTTLGVVRLDPSQTKINRSPPPIFLREVLIDGIAADLLNSPLDLSADTNRMMFSYHGLDFSAPEKVTYRARLLGFEDTWRETGTQRSSSYSSVPPGKYVFQVAAMNGDGVLSTSPAAIEIVIRPHYWQTGWFIAQLWLLVVLLAGGIGWIIARSRLNRRIYKLNIRSARETERSRIARDLHDDLGASLTEISLLAGLSAEQAKGSEFQSHLEDLSSRSRAVALALDEIVWAVNPREDSLGSLIDYLGGFASEFLDRAGIALRLRIPPGLPDAPIDTTVRHSIFLCAREAFNNVAKHSEATSAWLHVTLEGGVLEIFIEDDGRGINPTDLSQGDGLRNFEKRMNDCGGRCDVRARPAGGTIVRFSIPLLPPHKPSHSISKS